MFTGYSRVVCSVFAILFIFISGSSMLHAAENGAAKPELVILNWSEYMDPDLVKKFEEKYDARVREIYYESDDYRDNYMLETKGEGIDLIVSGGIAIRRYKQQGWIVPLTEKEVPNLKYTDPQWLANYEDAEGYAIPYFWGTMGIAYRTDLVTTEVKGWKDIYQPDESLRGKIAMMTTSRELIGMALKSLGYSINSSDFKELEEARQLLIKQQPYVRGYDYIGLTEKSELITGDVWMSLMYSGDALMVMDHDGAENIEYVVPEEGGLIWVDVMSVSQASNNKQLAYQFLDFINEPEHAAQLAEFVYYASPNKAAEKLLPADFKADEVIYPPKEVLDKSEVYTRLKPRATRLRNEIFSRIVE